MTSHHQRSLHGGALAWLLVQVACSRGPATTQSTTVPPTQPPAASGVAVLGPTRVEACPGRARAVSVGWSHACAVCDDGAVTCWGTNFRGNLGAAVPPASQQAQKLAEVPPASLVSAGGYHSCALLQSGGISCWGANTTGQLGDGSMEPRPAPVSVAGIAAAVDLDVSLGNGHSCAVLRGGTVSCWGNNFNAQLGDGTLENRGTPQLVEGLAGVRQVSVGPFRSCALHTSGEVSCWGGRHNTGQPPHPHPIKVAGVQDAVHIATGSAHVCALRRTGQVLCWGDNGAGQLGDGSWQDSSGPSEVLHLQQIAAIDTTSDHTCALHRDGRVSCWGANEHGQLGPSVRSNSNHPITVAGLADITQVATGHRFSCALGKNGVVSCWGDLSTDPPEPQPPAGTEPAAESDEPTQQ